MDLVKLKARLERKVAAARARRIAARASLPPAQRARSERQALVYEKYKGLGPEERAALRKLHRIEYETAHDAETTARATARSRRHYARAWERAAREPALFPVRLRAARLAAGLSQAALSAALGKRNRGNLIWRYERGLVIRPRAAALGALSRVLHVSVDWLMGVDEPWPLDWETARQCLGLMGSADEDASGAPLTSRRSPEQSTPEQASEALDIPRTCNDGTGTEEVPGT